MSAVREPVAYEGQRCTACHAQLVLEDGGVLCTVSCPNCGVVRRIMVTACGGGKRPGCGAHIIFDGKRPINVASGLNHFIDCPRSQSFRKGPKPPKPPEPPPPQRELF